MEDNYMSGIVPMVSESDLYDGTDIPDVDPRYRKDEVIEDIERDSHSSDVFDLLSREVSKERYQIRTPEQQAEWTEKKTQNTRLMAKYLLRLRFVMRSLMEKCYSPRPNQLFGVFETKEGEVSLNYSEKYAPRMGGEIKSFLDGDSDKSLEQMIDMLVGDFNLGYAQFTRKIAIETLKKHSVLKKIMEEHVDKTPDGSSFSLFDTEHKPKEIIDFEEQCDLDWATICTLLRNVRLLHHSSERLKERLVTTNMRSCFRTAMKHYHAIGGVKNVNFDEKDLISEATMGLMHAADMYVHGTSAKFTTYAEYWVRLKVSRYTKDNNSVRIPVYVTDMVQSIIKIFRDYEKEQGRSCSLHELPSYEEVCHIFKKKINKSIWQQALNRFSGQSLSMSCVTREPDDEGELSFDVFSAGDNENFDGDENSVSQDARRIMSIARSLVSEVKANNKITPEQYRYLQMHFVHDMKNNEIAEACPSSKDPKQVRSEINKAIKVLRNKLGVRT